MRIKHFFFILFFYFVFSAVHADSASDTLSSLLKNMRSMQANFTQNILDKRGKSVQQSTGRMLLQRPNQFRWETLQPNRQLIVTNGKRLWIYDPDLEQVTIRSLAIAAGETPAMLLSDANLSLTKEFNVRTISSSSQQQFLLTPKDKSNLISALTLIFIHNQIHAMHLQDHLGHTTVIQFSHIKNNPALAPALFHFKPPAHVDIIDEVKH